MSLPSPLPTRRLGKSGPLVPAMGVGLMSLAGFYGGAGDDAARLSFLDDVYAMGATHWDDADAYGDTEELVGKWFAANADKRKDVFVTTKFGFAGQNADGSFNIRSDPEWIVQACESSLKKMQTDYIDLYYCHRVDGKTPIEETIKTMVELKNQGKIKYLGLSEVSASTLRRAHAVHPITALQVEYSPWALEIETNTILDTCKELGIAIVAYSPLGRGFLTGQIKSAADVLGPGDTRAWLPRFQPDVFDKNLELVTKIKEIVAARADGVEVSQFVLAWVLRQWEEGVHALPGTRSSGRVKENLGALNVKVSDEEDRAVRAACEACVALGGRYPAVLECTLDGETPALK